MNDIDKEKIPYVTVILIIVNAVIGLLTTSSGIFEAWDKYAMYQGAIQNHEAYKIFTSAFIHSDSSHIVHNMISLGIFGYTIENEIGRIRFSVLYVLGIIGSGLMINFCGGANTIHAGASGAIYAVVVTAIIIQCTKSFQILYLIFYVVYDLYYNITSHVSWQGHLGGAIVGAIFAGIYLLIYFKSNHKDRNNKNNRNTPGMYGTRI